MMELQLAGNYDSQCTSIAAKSLLFFKEAQYKWIESLKARNKGVRNDYICNIQNGGLIHIVDLIYSLRSALSDNKEFMKFVIDQLFSLFIFSKEDQKLVSCKLIVQKIMYAFRKFMLTMEDLFNVLDIKKVGYLTRDALIQGLIDNFQIILSKKEINLFLDFLDSDGNGTIDLSEFISKMKINEYDLFDTTFLISKSTFVLFFVEQWLKHRENLIALLKNNYKLQSRKNSSGISLNELKALLSKDDIDKVKSILNDKDGSTLVDYAMYEQLAIQYKILEFNDTCFTTYMLKKFRYSLSDGASDSK